MLRKNLAYGCFLLINRSKSYSFLNRYHMVPYSIKSRNFFHSSLITLAERKKDYIDAEIINEDKTYKRNEKTSENPTVWQSTSDSNVFKEKSEGGGILKSIGTSIAKWFGQDEESLRKKKQKQEINTAIDKVFEGSGLIGGVFGSLAKSVGGMMVETLTEQVSDIQSLQEVVKDRLERNPKIIQTLGPRIRCSAPFSTLSSSSNINGVINKRMSCMMQAEGEYGSGTAQVESSTDGGDHKMKVNTLIVRLFDGRVIKVGENDRGRTGGGGPGKSDSYIDAEFVSKS